ncbi:CDP-glycerol glycerophosphotransferase family protein [Phocicoccus pinnipedialis]|uniref:CDP-Glycerol:Poly(Glycerophosphate) glycerophosphotransferase n=1 Tax=Phocicoccus pinnipedialis TaxID=110845 RepID=A0A6V7R8E4_9BACL|nr:CDP-glycerol glycerophosphotransferase family protein [Jeotgalicoccus pinnipedialis]MBP1938956.1 hypothetical protein [Jeotgalicoccus pinnipedialis]CAD2073205.1 CDP-Glycerol:Poly(glycerophosphate) glycerophosphotransferase [Jeotgalicoccus pinnipedialis]
MSTFTNYFSKHVREKFTKFIELIDINEEWDHFTFTYEVLPFINLRVISNYTAKVFIKDRSYPLDCTYQERIIKVKLPRHFFDNTPDNLMIQLYSFDVPMRIKLEREPDDETIKTQYIINEKLYNIKAKRDTYLSKRFMTLNFKESPVEIRDLNVDRDSFNITFEDFKVSNKTQLFLSYPHKFVELIKHVNDERTLTVFNIDDLTHGRAQLYIGNNNEIYPVSNTKNLSLKLFSKLYLFDFKSVEDRFTIDINEHIVYPKSFTVNEVEDEKVKVQFDIDSIGVIERPQFGIYDFTLDVLERFDMSDDLSVELPIEALINDYTRKKINIINDDIKYQVDISQSYIKDYMSGEVTFMDEVLTAHFYKRRDDYLGFSVKRPKLLRRITDVKDFTFTGFVKEKGQFNSETTVMIFEDRYSGEQYVEPINKKFNLELNTNKLLEIMSRDKTVIDVFVGMLDDNLEIITKAKITYKHSNYKKDNYYEQKVITKENGDHVHFLVTTTPFNNLKIETFVVPKALDTRVVRNKNVWLIGERSDTAQENGITLFNYLREHTSVDAYYVIEKDSLDYEKIKHLDNVLTFGSLEHFKKSLEAGVLLCTHDFENILPYKPAGGFFNYEDTLKVFLQHGVLGRKPAEYHKKYYNDPFDLFIVSSDEEKFDVVMKEMGYSSDEVVVTGLARFDQLPLDQKASHILLMPTWRDWINTDDAFLESEYYLRYKSLIENERLHEILDENNVYLNFYPHYRAQPFFNTELLETNDRVNFIELGERTVQDLLIAHALLITDYSSVSFDFTMMKKPVLYYHFDESSFFNRGILRPVNETFLGDIAETEEQLISDIEKIIKDEFKANVDDLSGIFKFIDHDNCKRIYEVVSGVNRIM